MPAVTTERLARVEQHIHTPGKTASQVQSLDASPVRPPNVVRIEYAEATGRHLAVFSIDYGDGTECAGLVVLVAPSEGLHIAELYAAATGNEQGALLRAIAAYTSALETIAESLPVLKTGLASYVAAPRALGDLVRR